MGRSLVEEGSLVHARGVLKEARRKSVQVVLPLDLVTSTDPDTGEPTVVGAAEVPDDSMALDVGPATLEIFSREVEQAGTVFWNGPLGMYERPPFDRSTVELAGAVSRSMAFSVVGGGDSAAAVRKLGLESRFDHISTGGGASLAFVGGQELPGLRALEV
jgi:phosphoglycerate kinase